jgi:hypothetical protein
MSTVTGELLTAGLYLWRLCDPGYRSHGYSRVTTIMIGASLSRPDQLLYAPGWDRREMSESPVETDTGGTGEVTDTGAEDTTAEDTAADEALAALLENDPDHLKAQVAHWQKTAQRHEKTARNNSAAALRLKELEDANKSELERAVEAREAAERERDAVRAEHTRSMAAAAHDLDPDLTDYLGDGTDEEINTRAEQLAGIIKSAAERLAEQMAEQAMQNGGRTSGGARRGRPVETMRPGAAPAGSSVSDSNDMFRQLLTGNRDS